MKISMHDDTIVIYATRELYGDIIDYVGDSALITELDGGIFITGDTSTLYDIMLFITNNMEISVTLF